jgi:hypothetical protein
MSSTGTTVGSKATLIPSQHPMAMRVNLKTKRSLDPPITPVAFDEILDVSDDKQATSPRRPYRET